MPDKGTLQDHLDDVRAELKRTQDVLHTMTDTAHRLHGEVEDYKAANIQLRYQLELAREMPEPYQRFIALLVKDIPCTCTEGTTCVATAVRDKLQTVWPEAWKWAEIYG